MTAYALTGDHARFLEAGMDEYISKPIRAPELFAVIEAAVAGTGRKTLTARTLARA